MDFYVYFIYNFYKNKKVILMIGDMIAKARKDKNMTKTQLAKLIKVDMGHKK